MILRAKSRKSRSSRSLRELFRKDAAK